MLSVPYTERAEARSLGADFDKEAKKLVRALWRGPKALFQLKWPEKSLGRESSPTSEARSSTARQTIYLAVPFSEKNEAKAQRQKWDGKAKSW